MVGRSVKRASWAKAPAKSSCPPRPDPYLGSWEIECVVSGEQKTWLVPPPTRKAPCTPVSTPAYIRPADLPVKPSLRVSPLLCGFAAAVCKCVSAIRKMGGMVSRWSAAVGSTGRGPPGPALSSFLTYCCSRLGRGPEKCNRRPLVLFGRFFVLWPRSVGWQLRNWARRRRHSLNETFLSFLLCNRSTYKCCCSAYVIHENVVL